MYNEITDSTGKVSKTAAQVQATVGSLLRQFDTSKVFADGIGAEYAAPGKAGNDLYARLLAELASLPSPHPAAGPKPTRAMMDAAAQVIDREAHLFSMRDTTKPGIDIMGEVRNGELQFMVRAALKNTAERGTLSGSYMFERMLAHFASENTALHVIQGNWYHESNLTLFNRLLRIGLPPEQAAIGTRTGHWAAAHGYNNVIDIMVEPPSATPGAYTKVSVRFRK